MLDEGQNAFSEMSELLEQALPVRPPKRGEVVEGEVIQVDGGGIMLSVGLKTEGIVPPEEMRTLSAEEVKRLRQGDKLLVKLIGGEGPGGMVLLSVDGAQRERRWRELEEHLRNGTEVTACITGHNRGGLVVDVQGIRGFVPLSHVAPVSGEDKGKTLPARVGEEAQFHVLELDRSQNRLILSERAIWRRRREEARERFLAELKEGTLCKGKVAAIRDFGVFVDLGDAEGLIPLSELAWGTVKSADEVLKVGDEVEVYVLRVNRESKRITLSLKRTQPEPWEMVHQRYQVGQIVEGTVTRLTDFGAFVKLEEEVEGLIHISELSPRRVRHAKECVYVGQKVIVKILGIDTRRRRISLSYKQAFGF